MGKGKKNKSVPAPGNNAKTRHRRQAKKIDWALPAPEGLNGRLQMPKPSLKHKTYIEFVENKNKKKKLEFQMTKDRQPPPGYRFVPAGNPKLSSACKDLSREQDAMMFIVEAPAASFAPARDLNRQTHRIGYHFREAIVEKAEEVVGCGPLVPFGADGIPEPVPERQEDITKQADAAIRDLFPRIPNMDRTQILERAFNLVHNEERIKSGNPPLVGLAADITLSRRVQLAVLAHIRHTHTRYDELLRETSWENARKTVESICLGTLVKWRGDEETGRDQVDEILREVIVISDSEGEDDEDGDDEDESSNTSLSDAAPSPPQESVYTAEGEMLWDQAPLAKDLAGLVAPADTPVPMKAAAHGHGDGRPRTHQAGRKSKLARKDRRRAAQNAQRGFSRYQAAHERAQAAHDRAWVEAFEQRRRGTHVAARPSDGFSRPQPVESYHGEHGSQPNLWHSGPRHEAPNPPVALPANAVVEQEARWPARDPRDQLVRSIEPYSPEGAHFPSQLPVSTHGQEFHHRSSTLGYQADPVRRYPQPFDHGSVSTVSGHQLSENQDFITLSQRNEEVYAPQASATLHRHRSPVSPHPLSARGVNSMEATGDYRLLGPRIDSTIHNGGPLRRSESRPIWIGDEDSTRRSEQNPIVIHENSILPRHVVVGHHRDQRPVGMHITNLQTSRPVYLSEERFQQVDNGLVRRGPTQRLPDDAGDFVRVENMFPRRHEAPRPVQQERYDHWSKEPSVYDVGMAQRAAQVLLKREEPAYQKINGNEHARVVGSPTGPFQRQERVVGIQYLPTQPIHPVSNYVDRQPVPPYERENVGYRTHLSSVAPELSRYSNPRIHESDQPLERDDGVIVLTRRH